MRDLNQFMDMLHIYNNIKYGEIVLTGKCLDENKKLIEVEGISNDVKIGDTIHRYPVMFDRTYFRINNKSQEFTEGSKYRFVITPIAQKRRGLSYEYQVELI
jgi:hypothetical protein